MNKWLARLRALDSNPDPSAKIFGISETTSDQTAHRVFGDNEDFGTRQVAEISPCDAFGHTPGVPQEATRRGPDCPTPPRVEISEIVGTAAPSGGKGATLDDVLSVFADARVLTCSRCGGTAFGAVDGGEVCVTCRLPPPAGDVMRPAAVEVLAQAETLGLPCVPLRQGLTIVGTAVAWRTFVGQATPWDLALARDYLTALAAPLAARRAGNLARPLHVWAGPDAVERVSDVRRGDDDEAA
jgi:hypothetical protein